ncbi:hypothetical protein N657DRAFT_207291 [Parathielavia appendiculata]|uniref:Uncharacterized protein n=1 Tax=Parathielavia appendiculata TaxID=2587402 RepID=A0AAN6U6V6_9PEZI|nr:hypothetical protein N657DRAFT_207291 [Parathielavia appendiculata]
MSRGPVCDEAFFLPGLLSPRPVDPVGSSPMNQPLAVGNNDSGGGWASRRRVGQCSILASQLHVLLASRVNSSLQLLHRTKKSSLSVRTLRSPVRALRHDGCRYESPSRMRLVMWTDVWISSVVLAPSLTAPSKLVPTQHDPALAFFFSVPPRLPPSVPSFFIFASPLRSVHQPLVHIVYQRPCHAACPAIWDEPH